MENTQELLQSICRKLNSSTRPLWKLEISDDEYKALKETLKVDYQNNSLDSHKKLLVIYCAEWWRREYEGGTLSYEKIGQSIGIDNSRDEIKTVAEKGAEKLGIQPIKKRINNLLFQAILLQGGFPLRFVTENSDSGYFTFLKKLLFETMQYGNCDEMMQKCNYDISILEVSQEIIDAVIAEDDSRFPFAIEEERFRVLVNTLKSEKKKLDKQNKNSTLKTSWLFDNGQIKFQIGKLPNSTTFKSQANRITITIDNKQLAIYDYNKQEDGQTIFGVVSQYNKSFVWNGEPQVFLESKANGQDISNTFPTIVAPDFDEPQIFIKDDEEKWMCGNTTKDTVKAVLFKKDDWQYEQTDETYNINGTDFLFVQFDDKIELTSTEETKTFYSENANTDYDVDVRLPYLSWLEKANYNIIKEKPHFTVYRKNDENQTPIPRKDYKVEYRQQINDEWRACNRDTKLSNGFVDFRITFPDGKNKIQKFFFADDLNCEISNGKVEFSYNGYLNVGKTDDIRIEVTKQQQEKLSEEDKNKTIFTSVRKGNTTSLPETCKFKIKANNGNSRELKIETLCPINVIMVTRNGEEIDYNDILEESSLYKYNLVWVAENRESIRCELFSNGEKLGIDSVETLQNKGIKSLSALLDESIKKLHALCKVSYMKRSLYFQVSVGNKTFKIRNYSLDTFKSGNAIQIKQINFNEDTAIQYPYSLKFVPVDVSASEITVETLQRIDDFSFALPENSKIIVFSERDGAEQHIIPRFYDTAGADSDEYTRRQNRHNNIKENLKQLQLNLDNFQSDSWQSEIKYYDIAIEYNLPFATFNCFTAISQSPELMLYFLIVLAINGMNLTDLERFERELAVAFHWIYKNSKNANIEDIVFNRFRRQIPNFDSQIETKFDDSMSVKEQIDRFHFTQYYNELNKLINNENEKESENEDYVKVNHESIVDLRRKIDVEDEIPPITIQTERRYFTLPENPRNRDFLRCLLSPVKVAETIMGVSNDLWNEENEQLRRIINYYREKTPDVYAAVLVEVIKQINNYHH
jgi:hypothetical protein